jgi:hypothetical protein
MFKLQTLLPTLSAVLGEGTLMNLSVKHTYAGLSKNSPSHAQQKRDSIKRKNKRSN